VHADGRLTFRPRPAASRRLDRGDTPLGLETSERDGVIYVPETAERNAPPIVFLHGATGTGRRELRAVLAAADRYGVVVVAPDSRGVSWDILDGGFGPDVAFIDRVLDMVADCCDVDMSRAAIGGISDGASYALSLGVINGDLFNAIIAFSPGFVVASTTTGRPRIFVSHGTADPILPIDATSRRLVPELQSAGYDVTFREFEGGHTVPPEVADEGFAWWVR
jgi:phospholipase/carboxylesterase